MKILIAFVLSFFILVPASAVSVVNVNSDAAFDYDTVIPDSVPTEEINSYYSVPEDVLNELSTLGMLNTVLEQTYNLSTPLLYGFDHPLAAVERLSENNNVFMALLEQPDLTSVLLEKYQTFDVYPFPAVEDLELLPEDEWLSIVNDYSKITFLEFLMIVDQIQNGEYSFSEKIVLSGAMDRIYEVLNQNQSEPMIPDYVRYSAALGDYDCFFRSTLANDNPGSGAVGEVVNVYTPNNSPVMAVRDREPEFSSLQKAALNAQMKLKYPNITTIAYPSVKYNCHSYAWYDQSTDNIYCIDDPSPYWTDGSYIRTYDPEIGDVAYIVTPASDDANHSGVIVDIESDGTVILWSKWGEYGLYEHKIDYGEYSGSAIFYY